MRRISVRSASPNAPSPLDQPLVPEETNAEIAQRLVLMMGHVLVEPLLNEDTKGGCDETEDETT